MIGLDELDGVRVYGISRWFLTRWASDPRAGSYFRVDERLQRSPTLPFFRPKKITPRASLRPKPSVLVLAKRRVKIDSNFRRAAMRLGSTSHDQFLSVETWS